jgi:hypothetical protein
MMGRAAAGWRGAITTAYAVLLVAACGAGETARADEPEADFASFLVLREIDLPRREPLGAATEWNEAAEQTLVKVLKRLDAPDGLVAGWREKALPLPAAGAAVAVADTLVAVRGRATFVAPRRLPAALAELFGRAEYDIVRIVDERGLAVDVVTRLAPKAWPRWQPIDEPAGVLGLPLATTVGPRPEAAPADAAAWPSAPASLLLGADRVAWYPDTPLGRLGMDYGLFDSVVDGSKLVAGDTAAFYALLAAVGRTDRQGIAAAAGGPGDVLALIDPGRKWFPGHRGDPIVIDGVAMRALRVPIDEPYLRRAVGSDHYWEVFVFVETPLIEVDGRKQTSFPIVCCVRELPPGMPSGERINERVRVAGFGLKRYAYSFEDPRPDAAGKVAEEPGRRQTTLLVGPQPAWSKPEEEAATRPIWVIAAVAIATAVAAILGLIYGNWSLNRSIRRSREELPDRIDLPGEDR